MLNGLVHANSILGHEAFNIKDWKVIGEYVYDAEGGRHQAFYSPVRPTEVMGEVIQTHERVQVEQSLKWSQVEAEKLWSSAGMTEAAQWKLNDEYGKWSSQGCACAVMGFMHAERDAAPPHAFLCQEGVVITRCHMLKEQERCFDDLPHTIMVSLRDGVEVRGIGQLTT